MSTFTADWLRLREPYDHRARGTWDYPLPALAARSGPLSIIDLATGTGSNLRFLAPRLSGDQTWRLLDHDAALLAEGQRQVEAWGVSQRYAMDRAPDGPARLVREGQSIAFTFEQSDLSPGITIGLIEQADLVTTSALIDLVSMHWIGSLVACCRAKRVPLVFGLNYDGRIDWRPEDPQDAAVAILVNRHQRSDKGMGLAVGPEAHRHTEDCLRRYGYAVVSTTTDWVLTPDDDALQSALLADWAAAARAVAPQSDEMITTWQAQREALIADRQSWLTVGHRDVCAWMP